MPLPLSTLALSEKNKLVSDSVWLIAMDVAIPSYAGGDLGSGVIFDAPFDDASDPLKLKVGTGSLTFTRAHDATHTATFVHPGTGLVTVASNNQLRIESAGALIEGARQNIILQSEVFNTTWVASNITVGNNSAVAPDGNTTADTLTASSANGTILQTIAGTASGYTFSVYLKRLTGTGNVDITANGTTYVTQTINSSTWTRCTVTATLTVASYTPGIRIATNADAVYAWGGQIELGPFVSSYIPTTSAAMTRNKDDLNFQTSGNVGATVGSICGQMDVTGTSITPSRSLVYIGTGWLGYNFIPNCPFIYDGTTVLSPSFNPSEATPFVMCGAWGASTLRVVANGGTVASGSFDGSMNLAATAYIGGDNGSNYMLFGHVKYIRIWDRALTDDEMKSATSDVYVGSTLHIKVVRNNEDITWNGSTWQAFPFDMEAIGLDSKGEIPSVQVKVSNVTGVMFDYLQTYDAYTKLYGYTPITADIYILNSKNTASNTPEAHYSFELVKPSANAQWATFTLGTTNPFTMRFPQNRIMKDHCRWKFKTDPCSYTGVESLCDKTLSACSVRSMTAVYGGFPGAGMAGIRLD